MLNIKMDKDFIYNNKLGWNWHKSWKYFHLD